MDRREHELLHAARHISFFATALWFWRSLSHGPLPRLGAGAAVLYLFGTSILDTPVAPVAYC